MASTLARTRTIYRIGAVLIAPLSLLAFTTPEPRGLRLLLPWVWAAHVATVGELVGRGMVSPRRGGAISSTGGMLILPALVALNAQGDHSVLFTALVAMPLIIAALAPEDRTSVVIFGVGALAWVAALGVHVDATASKLAADLLLTGGCFAIALAANHAHDRARQREQRAVDEKLAAQASLARLELARAATERLSLLEDVAVGVAHQVNNPLTFILANVGWLRDQLRRRGALDADTASLLDDMQGGGERINRIVHGLRQFCSSECVSAEPTCRPADAVNDALQHVAARLGPPTTVNLVPPDAPPVRVGRAPLARVLQQLLDNATDATVNAPGGAAEIHVLGSRAGPGIYRLVVEDNGRGIDPVHAPRLFEPFFTTKPAGNGTGLGLTLCQSLVLAAGGTIHAEGRPGGGARLVMDLPLADA